MPRLADDTYYTPQPLADAVCRCLAPALVEPRLILEPSAGEGAFVRAARAGWPGAKIAALDVRPECGTPCARAGAMSYRTESFLDLDAERLARFDLVLGNPPYSLAEAFVRHAVGNVHPGASVAFLLRLSFLGSRGRLTGLFREYPLRYLLPVVGRPSFTPDGRTDASEYGVFVWTREWFDHAQILDPVEWKGVEVADGAGR